ACALLALEFFASPRVARHAPGAIATLLACGAFAAWLVTGLEWLALGTASLALLLLVAWPVSFEAARQRITRLFTPKVAWAAVLALSLIASRYLAAHVLHALERQPPPQTVDLEDVPVRLTLALTDKGRSISLFHFKIHSSDAETQQFIDSNEKDRSQIIRLYEPNSSANC